MKTIVLTILLAVLVIGTSHIVYAGEGHDAGYEWAKKHDIRDTAYDKGDSESFNEGVRKYAEEVEKQEVEKEEVEKEEGIVY